MFRRHAFAIAIAGLAVALGTLTAVRGRAADPAPPQQQAATPWPMPMATMQHHFLQVTTIHEAVIRGDLAAAKAAASELAAMALPAVEVEGAEEFVAAIRSEAQRAAAATTLATAASATGTMLRQCGACHQRVVRPGIPDPPETNVGGIVGHMQEHQQALDQLLQGLVIPSTYLWSQGAGRLRGEPLPGGSLPRDPDLTGDIRQAEARVHELGEKAGAARDPVARSAAYAELLATCAACHQLHHRFWGPSAPAGRGAGS